MAISVHLGERLAHLSNSGGRSWGGAPSLALRVSPEPCLPPPPPHLGLCLFHPWCPVKTDLPLAREPHVLVLRQSSQWRDWMCRCWSLRPQAPILRESCGYQHCGKLPSAESVSSGCWRFWLFVSLHCFTQHPRIPFGQDPVVRCWWREAASIPTSPGCGRSDKRHATSLQ